MLHANAKNARCVNSNKQRPMIVIAVEDTLEHTNARVTTLLNTPAMRGCDDPFIKELHAFVCDPENDYVEGLNPRDVATHGLLLELSLIETAGSELQSMRAWDFARFVHRRALVPEPVSGLPWFVGAEMRRACLSGDQRLEEVLQDESYTRAAALVYLYADKTIRIVRFPDALGSGPHD